MKPKTNEELKALIKDGQIVLKEDLICNFDIDVDADINAWEIDAGDIEAWNINAWNINAGDIRAGDIRAWNINARDINAWNIEVWNINAKDIVFFAICSAFESLKCRSIKGRIPNAKYFCLDSEVIIESERE